jgi:acetate kinase
VDRGRSIDTSMGMTPLDGLVMGTRAGDIDAGILLHLMRDRGWSVEQMDYLLNRRSGLFGVSGVSNDARAVIAAATEGNASARLALDVFCYRVKKYIGAYYAVLNGCDALLFTGGIGEHRSLIRKWICQGLDSLGILLDEDANEVADGADARISAPASRVDIWVIPTNEELMIARDTARCILKARSSG